MVLSLAVSQLAALLRVTTRWVVLNTDETIAYATNKASNTVSIYPVKIDGTLGTGDTIFWTRRYYVDELSFLFLRYRSFLGHFNVTLRWFVQNTIFLK